MRKTFSILAVFTCLLVSGCQTLCPGLRVEILNTVCYKCGRGAAIQAVYLSLSDKSLSFVRLTLPEGKQVTLPNLVSGDGARYTDERGLVWWTKGDGAFTQVRGENGEWKRDLTCEEFPCRNSKP